MTFLLKLQINTFLKTLPLMLSRGFNETAGDILKMMQSAHLTRRMPSFTWKVRLAVDKFRKGLLLTFFE